MKKIASLMVLLAFCIPALAIDMPDMVGNWTGTFNYVSWMKNTSSMSPGNASGNVSYWEDNTTLLIEGQNGTRFAGKIIPAEKSAATEVLLGVISSDNESITLADENGLMWGWMVTPTEMELFYQGVDMDSIDVGGGIFTKE
jgi:hypothetical protein